MAGTGRRYKAEQAENVVLVLCRWFVPRAVVFLAPFPFWCGECVRSDCAGGARNTPLPGRAQCGRLTKGLRRARYACAASQSRCSYGGEERRAEGLQGDAAQWEQRGQWVFVGFLCSTVALCSSEGRAGSGMARMIAEGNQRRNTSDNSETGRKRAARKPLGSGAAQSSSISFLLGGSTLHCSIAAALQLPHTHAQRSRERERGREGEREREQSARRQETPVTSFFLLEVLSLSLPLLFAFPRSRPRPAGQQEQKAAYLVEASIAAAQGRERASLPSERFFFCAASLARSLLVPFGSQLRRNFLF